MKQLFAHLKQFFSRFTGKKMLPSIIVRSGLPIVFKPLHAWQQPKSLLARFTDRIKAIFRR